MDSLQCFIKDVFVQNRNKEPNQKQENKDHNRDLETQVNARNPASELVKPTLF